VRRSYVTPWAAALAVVMIAASFVPAAAPKKGPSVHASVAAARKAGGDFDLQGEYEGTIGGDARKKIGVQVIALGGDQFQAVFLAGGLPGAGWDGKTKVICQGKLDGEKAVFEPARGNRKYLAGPPEQFSATREFPPKTQRPCTAVIEAGRLTGKTASGAAIAAKKVMRKSPTLGAKPPTGAKVLLPYRPGKAPSLAAWANQKWKPVPAEGHVIVSGGSNRTKEQFEGPWVLHVEFMTPFRPTARGQGRGNSGVFPPGGREIQVLDSFGLDGMPNEAGGIYKSHPPKVNMCLPPLSWQTYDITYTPAGTDAEGKKQPACYKVVHNGVTIHAKIPLGRSRRGSLNLQDHGNPVCYRNIWIVLKK